MASPQGLSIECCHPNGQAITSGEIDAWELKAARRALRNLKTLLEGQPMLDLIDKQMQEADNYYRDLIAKSNKKFKESRIDLKAHGLTSAQFLEWFREWINDVKTPEGKRRVFLNDIAPAHPEHYAIPPYPAGIIETIGGHVGRVRIEPGATLPDFVNEEYGDPTYRTKLTGTAYLDDGSLFFHLFQELRDSEDGCDFRLRILYPAASPQSLLDEHSEHLAVEFRSFLTAAYERHRRLSGKP